MERRARGDAALVRRVQQDPAGAVVEAEQSLAGELDPVELVRTRWALGLARRELGELARARTELEAAWVGATELDDPSLAAQIAVTLALVVAYQGDLPGALSILDVSEPTIDDEVRGHLHLQRGIIHYQRGELTPALTEYDAALDLFERTGDEVGGLKIRINLGALFSYAGRLRDARVHLEWAAQRAPELGETLIAAVAEQNLAHLGALEGDFPAAFESFERAARHFEDAHYEGPFTRSLRLDHARALLQANLLDEARAVAARAVKEADRTEGDLDLAESLLVQAEVLLAVGDVDAGTAAARRSADEFDARDRRAWAALARSVHLRGLAGPTASTTLADDVLANADELAACGYGPEAVRARLLGTDVLIRAGALDTAAAVLFPIERSAAPSVVQRASILRLRAMIDAGQGRRASARRNVNLGLRLLAEHQAVLGAIELRAHAAGDSDGLATIGVRMAVEDGRPRQLLAQLEATRRSVSLMPAARPPDDDVLSDLLAQLRRMSAQQRDAAAQGDASASLARDRVSLERQIRWHVRRAPAGETQVALPLAESIRRLGDRALVEYANLGGRLLAVSVLDNRTSMHDLGPVDGLLADIDAARHALHRLNRTQGSPASRASAAATLGAIAADLAERLLPRRVLRSGRPVVVVPTGVLHALPWGALPGLIGRAVSIAPSLTGWALATERREAVEHVALVAGPGLDHADEEVAELAAFHGGARVLIGEDATADHVLDAIGKCDLAHLACHGSYRSDNPLFSTLRMHDGQVTAYDLERCPAIPRTVVLSACNVALGAPAGGGALLGLAAALMAFGAGSVIAPLTPVSDERVVPIMTRFHARLLEGSEPALALALASVTEDGMLDPTAAAFVALGA